MSKSDELVIIPAERIDRSILVIRGHKVILDEDLAKMYQVTTSVLVQAVKRNLKRFPKDFMFQLSTQEHSALRSQIVISTGKTGRRYAPYAFTEQGVAMLSSVLNSERAIFVNIEIMRAFVRMRDFILSHKELAGKLDALEKKYDAQFKVVFNSIRDLMKPSEPRKRKKIGFGRDG